MIDGSDQIFRGGDGTALRFYYEPAKNNFLSEQAGRAVFDTVLYVEVLTPGSTESVPKFEVERTLADEAEKDAQGNRVVRRGVKYPQYVDQIEAFKRQTGEYTAEGTPISQWAQIDVGTAASLKAAGIHTVEMLASVSDGHLQNLGTGGRVMRDQAIAFINARQFGVPTAQMAADTANVREENIRLRNEVRDLADRLNTATAQIDAMRSGTPGPVTLGGPDPLSMFQTPTQPNPGASMEAGAANPLTPADAGEANENMPPPAQQLADPFGQPQQQPAQPQQPNSDPPGTPHWDTPPAQGQQQPPPPSVI